MKRPAAFNPQTAYRAARKPARSRAEAAVQLVRVEYERARLETEIDTLTHRRTTAARNLARLTDHADALMVTLDRATVEKER